MVELELSLIWGLPEALADALRAFEAEHRIRVHVQILDPTREQRQLADYAVFRTGPDVSEVGSTWLSSSISMDALRPFTLQKVYALSSLISMDAVRPFTLQEEHALGGAGAFFAPIWQAGVAEQAIIAVPWRADTRVIYYRRDLLHQAGIDEQTAFATVGDLQHTLDRLRTAPEGIPCAIPTNHHPMILHVLAPWVWQAGGKFVQQDGRKTAFAEPEALAGITRYFETFAPVLTPAMQGRTDSEISNLFAAGQIAVTVSGYWLLDMVLRRRDVTQVVENLGVALTPGARYIGGMNLVIWRHSRHLREAFALVQFLTQRGFQQTWLQQAGYLPARQDVLDSPPFTTDPRYHRIGESLRSGQGFNAIYMWGLVEERLTTTIYDLWQQIFANPHIDLAKTVTDKLNPMAEHLDRILMPNL